MNKETEDSLNELERDLARVGFWYAVQMSAVVGFGIFLFGLLN